MATVTDKELREAFGIVSTSVQGLNETQLGTALRSLAFNPTDAFVKEIFGQLSSGGYVSADGLVKAGGMCAAKLSADTRKRKLKDAFTVFDKEGKGTIASAEVRDLLASLPEQLSDDDVDDLIYELDPDRSGTIDIEHFVKMIYAKPQP